MTINLSFPNLRINLKADPAANQALANLVSRASDVNVEVSTQLWIERIKELKADYQRVKDRKSRLSQTDEFLQIGEAIDNLTADLDSMKDYITLSK